MTCIVGLEHNGKVYMGGDSAISEGWSHVASHILEKVFIKDTIMIGCSWSLRAANLLHYALNVPEHSSKKVDMEYLVTDLTCAIRTCFRNNGILTIKDNQESSPIGLLIGYKGGLYKMGSQFCISRSVDGFTATGSGMDIALGSLHSTKKEKNPQKRITLALEAAAHFDSAVQAPFTVISL